MALSTGRAVSSRRDDRGSLGVAQGKHIYEGALVCASGGYALPGAHAIGLIALGVAEYEADNTAGNDGDLNIDFRFGTFLFGNSAGADAITIADIGKHCYVVDDETVARTDAGNTRSPAGRIVDVAATGVWVRVGPDERKAYLPLRIDDLVGADARVFAFTSPVNGEITDVRCSLERHALAAGDATLTGRINGAAITGGLITITQAGSAVGDKDEATPTALNVVAVGDRVNFTVGGANTDATAFAQLVVTITY
ncbi:MAG TPA: hypothetical protein VGG48_14205 [Rhizomicrobium sp.]|jgi:hypothetical protein